jgi:hypothetical protein
MTDREKIGDGITARYREKREMVPADEGLRLWAEHLSHSPWERHQEQIEAARAHLIELLEDCPKVSEDLAAHNDWRATYMRERQDLAWYLAEIDAHAKLAEDCRENGNTDWAMHHAMMIAEAFTEMRFKQIWEPNALRGQKVGEGLAAAAKQTNLRHSDLREKRFARLRELLDRMNLESAIAACEAEGLGRADAIKRQWNRHKENRDS